MDGLIAVLKIVAMLVFTVLLAQLFVYSQEGAAGLGVSPPQE